MQRITGCGIRQSLHAWPDRWIWVDARESRKNAGWLWEWTFEGRLVGHLGARDLIEMFERTVFQVVDAQGRPNVDEVAGIWKHCLATGPKLASE
ncbi:MAG: hypothetical protein H6883_15015 [Rhodobiaceae bacterium]|nr:hypothetical protein [Rhodobiaceae bacterium]MCC0057430.1 hypothetical protein [Rhodobiaceae bacterium]